MCVSKSCRYFSRCDGILSEALYKLNSVKEIFLYWAIVHSRLYD